ncbi:helix-turn-helix transcriptional regulator [Paenibacillus sp. JX-17]|uniref:Helix-turn-helix transcriptional regulator n=1 Tax=Paenibacillus lacisoli TaxID=3064525 RepID=A0ABT9CDD0_9BACL|nr:helix-turn-helix transcriptional regulator [Paenibacillus sp. JX-17]MDO7907278.1 helix-turn-helix transcriptional regulator [Paenibacillus sp. JX-17]
MQSIYQRIEELIAARGMTKKAFCQQLGISAGNFGDWKRGKSVPGTAKLIEIAGFFDVSLDWLMLGRRVGPETEMLKEQQEGYFFQVLGQLNCQMDELSEEEIRFIKEYIAFTRFRRQQDWN